MFTPPQPLRTSAADRPTSTSSSRSASPMSVPALADVQTAFQCFSRAEVLDSGYKCETCGKVGRATNQSRLASVPPILTLHLKRFRYGDSCVASASAKRSP
jgi:ubiquitin C-terminal hydrolase